MITGDKSFSFPTHSDVIKMNKEFYMLLLVYILCYPIYIITARFVEL